MNQTIEGRKFRAIPFLTIKKGAGGFTTAELVVTLAIIGIVGSIAVPSFNQMGSNGDLRAAARDIMSDIANLKERAMAENANFSITFDKDHNTYTFPGMASGKSPVSFGPGIHLTAAAFGGGSTVSFLSRGTLFQGGSILLTNGRGSIATITCNLAGRTYAQFNMQ
jgi:Tfp pilus assembly protein PilE